MEAKEVTRMWETRKKCFFPLAKSNWRDFKMTQVLFSPFLQTSFEECNGISVILLIVCGERPRILLWIFPFVENISEQRIKKNNFFLNQRFIYIHES